MALPKSTEAKKVNLDFNKEFINTFTQNIESRNVDFINQNLKFYKGRGLEISTPGQELEYRLKLEECEKFNTPFILNQIQKYMNKVEPETELFKRIILSECEKHTTEWVEKNL